MKKEYVRPVIEMISVRVGLMAGSGYAEMEGEGEGDLPVEDTQEPPSVGRIKEWNPTGADVWQ